MRPRGRSPASRRRVSDCRPWPPGFFDGRTLGASHPSSQGPSPPPLPGAARGRRACRDPRVAPSIEASPRAASSFKARGCFPERMVRERIEPSVREGLLGREIGEQRTCEIGQLVDACTQRREFDSQHIESIHEDLSGTSVDAVDSAREVADASRDHAAQFDRCNRLVPPTRVIVRIFQRARSGPGARTELTHLRSRNTSRRGPLRARLASRVGTRERALPRDRRAVDRRESRGSLRSARHEGALRARVVSWMR